MDTISLDRIFVKRYFEEMLYTTNQVAVMEQCTARTVQNWCRKQGFKKVGRDYYLLDYDILMFRERKKPGGNNRKK